MNLGIKVSPRCPKLYDNLLDDVNIVCVLRPQIPIYRMKDRIVRGIFNLFTVDGIR